MTHYVYIALKVYVSKSTFAITRIGSIKEREDILSYFGRGAWK